jgi:hypothetical protein
MANSDHTIPPTVIKALTKHANEIVAVSYENVDQIFKLTDQTQNSPELSELAKSFTYITYLTGVSLSHFLIGNVSGIMGFWTFLE